jgi:hypothetical protein
MHRPIAFAILSALAAAACGDRRPAGAGDEGSASAAPAARSAAPAARGASGVDLADTSSGGTPIEITAVVDGREMSVKGLGECEHAGDGSIYERPASLWSARYDGPGSGDIRNLNLTFWRERSGTESVNLSIQVGDDVHRIATVEGGERQGSGTATLEGDARAGTIVVKGTSAEGKDVQVRAKCARFTTMVAEGG